MWKFGDEVFRLARWLLICAWEDNRGGNEGALSRREGFIAKERIRMG